MIFLSYFLVFVLQVLFTTFKVFEIKYAYENKLKPILITGAILSVLTVLSTYLSVDLLFKGDWFVIIIYVAGGLLGKYIAYKFNANEYRFKLYNKINNE